MASADTLFTLWTNKRDGKQQIRKAQGVGGVRDKVYGKLHPEFSVIFSASVIKKKSVFFFTVCLWSGCCAAIHSSL